MNTAFLTTVRKAFHACQDYERASTFIQQARAEDGLYDMIRDFAKQKGISEHEADKAISEALARYDSQLQAETARNM